MSYNFTGLYKALGLVICRISTYSKLLEERVTTAQEEGIDISFKLPENALKILNDLNVAQDEIMMGAIHRHDLTCLWDQHYMIGQWGTRLVNSLEQTCIKMGIPKDKLEEEVNKAAPSFIKRRKRIEEQETERLNRLQASLSAEEMRWINGFLL